jgi:hypothetical protein
MQNIWSEKTLLSFDGMCWSMHDSFFNKTHPRMKSFKKVKLNYFNLQYQYPVFQYSQFILFIDQ